MIKYIFNIYIYIYIYIYLYNKFYKYKKVVDKHIIC